MIDSITSLSLENLQISDLLYGIILILVALSQLLLFIFGWISLQKVRLLNRTLRTQIRNILMTFAILSFIITIGTLLISFNLWIAPLL